MADGLRVLAPGVASTLQDGGRRGYMRYGISGSGAMDPGMLALANGLVGNPPETGAIEITMAGPTLVCEAQGCRLAMAGAPFPIRLNDQVVQPYTAFDVARGDKVVIGATREGLRGYLAASGGFAVEPVLGSISTHTRSRLGGLDGNPLSAGDLVPLRETTAVGRPLALRRDLQPTFGGPIRVVLGPQDDYFTEAGLQAFLSEPYTLTTRADRMGCHLDGPVIAHKHGFNIVSDGIVNGSIQVPGHGRPIILLADRQTTGGYPKIATVISADLARLAQARPGDTLQFEAVAIEEARAIAREAHELLTQRLQALTPWLGGALDSGFLLACNLIGGVISAYSEE